MNQFLLFLSNFLKDPKSVGAVVPLSSSVVKQLIKFVVNKGTKKNCRVLEVGGGIGNVSKAIVNSLGDNDLLDIVEIDAGCCEILRKTFEKDSRVAIHCMSIIDWTPPYDYDFIISTLPFNSFKASFVKDIFDHYMKLCKPKGILTYVEYIGLQKMNLALSQGKKKKNIMDRQNLLNKLQDQYLIEKTSVMTNFLPCNVYHLQLHV